MQESSACLTKNMKIHTEGGHLLAEDAEVNVLPLSWSSLRRYALKVKDVVPIDSDSEEEGAGESEL